jgi:CTP:molybdopterin cytidylyltransferase MocA
VANARLGAVVLAAGAGTRMGGVAKALLRDGDQTFLARIVATAASAGVAAQDIVAVVAAPHAPDVGREARRLGTRVVENPAPERDRRRHAALGFEALASDDTITAAFLWPVDHPRIAATTLATLVAAGEGVPAHGERGGHPPLVPQRMFAALAACTVFPGGARDVVRGLARIPVDDPGVLADVDHPADLERLCAD